MGYLDPVKTIRKQRPTSKHLPYVVTVLDLQKPRHKQATKVLLTAPNVQMARKVAEANRPSPRYRIGRKITRK